MIGTLVLPQLRVSHTLSSMLLTNKQQSCQFSAIQRFQGLMGSHGACRDGFVKISDNALGFLLRFACGSLNIQRYAFDISSLCAGSHVKESDSAGSPRPRRLCSPRPAALRVGGEHGGLMPWSMLRPAVQVGLPIAGRDRQRPDKAAGVPGWRWR